MGVAAFDSDKTKINVEIPGNITVDKAHWISVAMQENNIYNRFEY